MKKTTITASPSSLKVFVLSGCTALAVSIAAVGQATQSDRDRPLNDRTTSPGISNQNQNQNHQTFEGKIKPLFKVLSQDSDSAGIQTSDATTRAGSPTSPGSASQQPGSVRQHQDQQPGSARQSQDATQRGANPQQDRPVGGINPAPTAGALNQPLALVCDSEMKSSSSTSSSTSSTSPSSAQDTSTSARGAGSTAATARGSERSTDRVTGTSAMGDSEGQVYVLVFDPSDPQSRTAYQMAQAIANSQHSGAAVHGRPGASGSSSTTPADPQQRQRDQLQPGASAQRSASAQTATGSGMDSGVSVKVTGELIERDGIQAIAVHRVDRQHGTDTIRSTQPYQGGQ